MAILTDENYVDKAEQAIKDLRRDKRNKSNPNAFILTTSKIRNLLNLTSNLYDESNNKDYSQLKDKVAYLRVQFVYQSGREMSVKNLVQEADILSALKEVQQVGNKETLQRFCRYMEALVAYFKFYGGKD
ncbi:CRISPR-associated protein, Csm2 family [Streptococcus sp. DD11]|uniref:type III-A CRISPR-associated protein Csm2 n=1 Tax=Streptococcus sp. DD11 TaxID=1777879 RepID=UPI00079882E4|nr:type III-A CRISPR-associated protein Csm2 [Streptococcus sp. DD11]KXT78675.1 CRISPR-associated protein, Csm2 family [Streptococcus sp. DD11]